MDRMTPERRNEIIERLCKDTCGECDGYRELIAELEAVEAERDNERAEKYADLTGQEHRLGTRIEILEVERETLRKENLLNMKKIDDLANQILDQNVMIDELKGLVRRLFEIIWRIRCETVLWHVWTDQEKLRSIHNKADAVAAETADIRRRLGV